MSDFSGDPIHPATPTRLEQARRDGDIPKSFELASAIQLLGGLLILFLLAGGVATWLLAWTRRTWLSVSTNDTIALVDSVPEQIQTLAFGFLGVIAPILVLLFGLSVFSHWLQTGPFFSTKLAAPQLERVSPTRWFRNTFSLPGLGKPVIGMPKMLLSLGVAIWMCCANVDQFVQLASSNIDDLVQGLFGLVLQIGLGVAGALLIFSLLDLAIQRFSYERRMRMTEQQLRDELRMQNGDPQILTRQRQFHQTMTRRV